MARKINQIETASLFGIEPSAAEQQSAAAPKRRRAAVAAAQTPAPEPVTPEPVAPEPVAPDQAGPEPVAPEPVAPEPVAPEPVAPEQAGPEPVAPEPVAPEPVAPEPVAPEQAGAITSPVAIPALDAPSVNTNEPAVSYKIDFSDKLHWHASEDGGKTKASTGSLAVGGCPIDLALQISKASWGNGFDQRFRLAFMQADGRMAELNINAINTTQAGELYVTSPARSLIGGLLAISESDEDITAFCEGARFRLRAGRGRGMFIEVDLACNGQWIAMTSPAATNQVAKDPAGLHTQLTLVKQRFRAAGFLLTAAAVIGEIADYDGFLRHLEDAGCDD